MAQRPFVANIASAALWAGIILVSALALYGTRPPAALDGSASPNSFSASRAISHLAHIARQPHPIGSDEAARVRAYLVEQLSGLGGAVQVEQAIGTAQYGRSISSGVVNNIVATFPGRAPSRAIMLTAHYDSVPEGPGAADDGAGLIVILEALRALRAGPPIKNDLIVLFSDGEEARGLLGAHGFVTGHPDLTDLVGMMVNLEARGDSGPALMFETSNDNGALIREFARAAPYPMANSLMIAIYKLLPNDTDFTPLKKAGLAGLNFAFIETYQSYHSRLDAIENLNPRSVQHTGANVLGIIRHFGNLPLPQTRMPDLVYFNWFGSRLLVYPVWLAWAVALLTPILLGFLFVRAAPRMGLTLGGTAVGFASFVGQLIIVLGETFAVFAAVKIIAGELLEGDALSNQFLFAGIMGIALASGITIQRILGSRFGVPNLATGQFFAVSLLVIVVCSLLMGGSYVLQWPLIFSIAAMFLAFRLSGPARSVCEFVFLIPALLILVPLAYLFFASLTFTYLAIAAAAFLLTTLVALALPAFDRVKANSKLSVIVILLVSVFLLVAGIHLSRWSAGHPRPDTLIYSVNANENKAKWVSYDDPPDAWTNRMLGSSAVKQVDPAYTAGLEQPVLSKDAGLSQISPPSVSVANDTTVDATRTLTLKLGSSRGARTLLVRLPADLKLTAAGWNGHVHPTDKNSKATGVWSLRFYNVPPEGAALELRFAQKTPIRIWVADITPGLPAIAPLSPRPDDTMPAQGSDISLVARMYEL